MSTKLQYYQILFVLSKAIHTSLAFSLIKTISVRIKIFGVSSDETKKSINENPSAVNKWSANF